MNQSSDVVRECEPIFHAVDWIPGGVGYVHFIYRNRKEINRDRELGFDKGNFDWHDAREVVYGWAVMLYTAMQPIIALKYFS